MNKLIRWVSPLVVTSVLLGSTVPAIASPKSNVKVDDDGVQVLLKFKDLKEAEWALRFIAAMEAEGVFKGYPDGTFKPNQPINRVEAVTTAVILMGLQEEAEAEKDTTLQFKDADLIERQFGWATGYVAVALENGLFDSTENYLHPGESASRLWVATMLVKALGLEQEALSKMNTELQFKDKNAIPAASVGYIAVAVEKGILAGYPDGTFRPNNTVTRAEMATLLKKSGENLPSYLKEKKKQKHVEYEGTVSAVSDNSLTVQDESEEKITLDLTDKILVFHGNGRGTLADIQVGDKIEVKMKNGRAVLIEIKQEDNEQEDDKQDEEEEETFEVSGELVSININSITIKKSNGTQVKYELAADLEISHEGDSDVKLSDLIPGMPVKVEGNNNLVYQIEIMEDAE